MGPITIFDKSFIQSLSFDESVWFDKFFMTNIVPIFFAETLADLEKAVRTGRTPEREVGIIADKTPQLQSYPNSFHVELCISNLLGYQVIMDGRMILPGGKPVKVAGQSGIVFDVAPETEAFNRWQCGQFLEIERLFAKGWREMIHLLDFNGISEKLAQIGIDPRSCKSIDNAKTMAESIIDDDGYSFERMKFILDVIGIPNKLYFVVWQRWGMNSFPSLRALAPYAAYIFMINLFFYIAVEANLISKNKVTNRIDLAYLYYLPFCMIFISSDKFHRLCAPLFLRDDQIFLWGEDVKADLQEINQYYDKLPEQEKEKGLFAIADHPPTAGNLLVSKMWDKFIPGWRKLITSSLNSKEYDNRDLVNQVNRFTDASPLKSEHIDFDLSDPDAMVIQRRIHKRRGKWWQLPKDFKADESS